MIFNYNNIPIQYDTLGKGPAVVLLHGFLESSSMWEPLLSQLIKKHTVITLDFPGHGKSGVISETHSMELMAEIVHEILQELNIETAVFIGHSMGGYVALAYAENYEKKVEKLILLNSTSAADSEERKQNRDRSIEIVSKIPEAYISMAIGNLFAEKTRDVFAEKIEILKSEALSFPIEGIQAALRGMRDRKDRTSVMKTFSREKYLISATEDPILPIEDAIEISKDTGTILKKLTGGHLSLVENPQAVAKYLESII